MIENNTNTARERLRKALGDKAYRRQYATSTLIHNVASQVQVLRRQRGLSQEELATKSGTKQPRISNVEAPPDRDKPPNWEIDTLNRIAQGLGTRLKISFETYGSLVEELDSVTSESLRRVFEENDPILFPLPERPKPDADAPERTRWMQEEMIRWLWEDKSLELDKLVGWLSGKGLPAVGHDEEPYHWLLRGIKIKGEARWFLEKRFAERLAVVLGNEPDVHPMAARRNDDFLMNLYWTCAGLTQPGFLAQQLWQAYRRLKSTKPIGAVRDALQGALVHNQFGEAKPLKEIWEPMIERGRHRWLRGNELIGYEGLLVRHATIKPDLDKILWALTTISKRWDKSRKAEFKRLVWKIPGLKGTDVFECASVFGRLEASARSVDGWSDWARTILPQIVEQDPPSMAEAAAAPAGRRIVIGIRYGGVELYSNGLQTWVPKSKLEVHPLMRPAQSREGRLALNDLLTELGNRVPETASDAMPENDPDTCETLVAYAAVASASYAARP